MRSSRFPPLLIAAILPLLAWSPVPQGAALEAPGLASPTFGKCDIRLIGETREEYILSIVDTTIGSASGPCVPHQWRIAAKDKKAELKYKAKDETVVFTKGQKEEQVSVYGVQFNGKGKEVKSTAKTFAIPARPVQDSCPQGKVLYRNECLDPLLSCLSNPDGSPPASCLDQMRQKSRGRQLQTKAVLQKTVPKSRVTTRQSEQELSTPEPVPPKSDQKKRKLKKKSHPPDPKVAQPPTPPPPPEEPLFSDIDLGTLEGKAAQLLGKKGISSGRPLKCEGCKPEFYGQGKLNKVEFSKFALVYELGSEYDFGNGVTEVSVPRDVDVNAWYWRYLKEALKRGILKGHPNGTIGPWHELETATALEIIRRLVAEKITLNRELLKADDFWKDIKGDEWYADAAILAYQLELVPSRTEFFAPTTPLTRYETAIIFYQLEQAFRK